MNEWIEQAQRMAKMPPPRVVIPCGECPSWQGFEVKLEATGDDCPHFIFGQDRDEVIVWINGARRLRDWLVGLDLGEWEDSSAGETPAATDEQWTAGETPDAT